VGFTTSGHLTDGGRRFGEEHQCGLTEHDVERLIRKAQFGGVTLDPLDVGAQPPGDDEHGIVQIEADHTALTAKPVGSRARHDAGPARDVEHLLARSHACGVHDGRRPVGEEGRHEARLIRLGGLDRELESLNRTRHWSGLPVSLRGVFLGVVASVLCDRPLHDVQGLSDRAAILVRRGPQILVPDVRSAHLEVGVHASTRQTHRLVPLR
jgi:hypothetical protein